MAVKAAAADKPGKATAKADEKPAPKPFTVGFNRRTSEGLFYGCIGIGIVFAAVSVVGGLPLLAPAAIAPFAMAYWHFPMIEKGKPQLGANEEGLYVERIGFIDWSAIRMTDVHRTKVRNNEQVKLHVLLTRSLEDAVSQAQTCPFWKKFMMRNWKRTPREHGRELIAINLHTLEADPEEILSRIRTFKFV
ncbi:hypothetical protein E1180_06610 [Roseibium denhamense]|uniref:DUF2244 domain-containing protein n=1 Tax=Roseibium denhamense TaxID=76305 RepID=A0ABY1P4M8_9HYPH|nr:hypothetical protein [Roseibium denhamense]MTI05183.1 hypothetical protein [Roseibium denhamense]SMP25860.1 hypothetical protein SAMN06265374_2621 [Roseibium denhamense]